MHRRLFTVLASLLVVACSVEASLGPGNADASSPTGDAGALGDAAAASEAGDDAGGAITSLEAGVLPDGAVCAPGMLVEGAQCLTPPMLDVVDYGGGVLATAESWIVVWQGDEATGDQLQTFSQGLFASGHWSSTLAEYHVTGGTAKGVIHLGAPPATADSAFYASTLESLFGKTATNATPFAANASTMVTFVIPKSTKDSVGGSYHDEATAVSTPSGTMPIPYVVLAQDGYPSLTDWDCLTWTHSHELVETVTDPHYAGAGWKNPLLDYVGEVADLCNNVPTKQTFGGTEYMLTRVYSAKAAKARLGNPCVPSLGASYANIAITPLDVHVTGGKGQSATAQLHAFSNGSTAPIPWQILEDHYYTVSPAEGTLSPGQEQTVTVTLTSGAANFPQALNLWVTSTNAWLPAQESVAGVSAK